MKRAELATLGQQTARILQDGRYTAHDGTQVGIADDVELARAQTRVITPEGWPSLEATAQMKIDQSRNPAVIEVTGETTLAAAQRLNRQGERSIIALNFASAKNPGGGFLGGSQAQEEGLARSSTLYASLLCGQRYYDANRGCRTLLYTDHAILSENVIVFRDDAGMLLPEPYAMAFITMPAVNRGAIRTPDISEEVIAATMRRRIRGVLALGASTGVDAIILGAWGCGVFRNDPTMIADLFAEHLSLGEPWRYAFRRIVFAVFDHTDDERIFTPFAAKLREL